MKFYTSIFNEFKNKNVDINFNKNNNGIMYEMSNILPQRTGLGFILRIMHQTGREKHGARIKVKFDNELIPITISTRPEIPKSVNPKPMIPSKDFNLISTWIIINRELLLSYWNNGENMDVVTVINNLHKV